MLYSSHFLFEKFMEKIISSQTVDTELRELIEEWNEACVKLLHYKKSCQMASICREDHDSETTLIQFASMVPSENSQDFISHMIKESTKFLETLDSSIEFVDDQPEIVH